MFTNPFMRKRSDERLFIVAPSLQRFVDWCNENGVSVNPGDKRRALFVPTIDRAFGHKLESADQIIDAGGDAEVIEELHRRVRP